MSQNTTGEAMDLHVVSQAPRRHLDEDEPEPPSSRSQSLTRPACFSTEEFLQSNFDADLFVAKCRGAVSLAQLREDLERAREEVRRETVQLIHRDYGEFIRLATSLAGLDRAVHALRGPLGQLRVQVQAVFQRISLLRSRVYEQLTLRQRLVATRHRLQLCVGADASCRKVESLMNPDAVEKDVMCERVAVELNRLLFMLDKEPSLPFIKTLRPKYQSFHKVLQATLDELFSKAVVDKNSKVFANCLRAYAAIDEISRVENNYRTNVVRPLVQKAIVRQKIEKNVGGSTEGLSDVYAELSGFLKDEFKFVLDHTTGATPAVSGYDFLVNSIFAEILDTFVKTTPSIFGTGIADSFHRNYSLTIVFLETLETFYTTSAGIKHFRTSQPYADIMKKFQIQTYFKLRFQEIAGTLETSLNKEEPVDESGNLQEFLLHSTVSVWNCLTTCWSSKVCLPTLVPQFYRVTLQIIARFALYLQDGLDILNGKTKESRAWIYLSSEQYVLLYHDLWLLDERASLFCDTYVQPMITTLPAQQQDLIKKSIKLQLSQLCSIVPRNGSIVLGSILKRCQDNLKPAKGIPAIYRMTNKPVPTKPSAYVQNVFQPWDKFLQARGNSIPSSLRAEWTSDIAQSVTNGYHEILLDALQTLKKTEDSLKKIQKKPPTTAAQGSVSDTEKICIQIRLDVDEFGNLLEKYGFEKRGVDAYNQLFDFAQNSNKMFAD